MIQSITGGVLQTSFTEAQLARPEFSPRALFERFNIEVLCTTDPAADTLPHHQAMQATGFNAVRPTLRPDGDANENLYGQKVTPQEIIAGKVPMPPEARQLIEDLQKSQSASTKQ